MFNITTPSSNHCFFWFFFLPDSETSDASASPSPLPITNGCTYSLRIPYPKSLYIVVLSSISAFNILDAIL